MANQRAEIDVVVNGGQAKSTLNEIAKAVDGVAASADKSSTALSKMNDGASTEKVSAASMSMRRQIERTTDSLTAQARAFDEVAVAEQKIGRKGIPFADVSASLGGLKEARAELNGVLQTQAAILAAERSAKAENAHWETLKLGKISEVKAAELAAIKAVQAENAHYNTLKDQWAAANQSRLSKEESALNAYRNSVKTAALEMEAMGKTASERAAIRGKIFGIPQAEIDAQVAGLRAVEQQIAKTNPRFNEMGMTAKGTAAALRQVPAQFTDIIVSLQGGQAPLTVLLQQGGQLKDVFGGVGNAFKALSSYVIGLINPFTLLAAAGATLALAYTKGSAEAEAYNKALITTGNVAGTTAGRLSDMAVAVSAASGSTTANAASALAQLASVGNVAEAQFKRIAQTATDFERVAGVAVADTVKQFSELGKEPVKASEKLNQTTHYLTAEIYAQIKALEDQGDMLSAGALAQQAWADALDGRIPKLADNLGILEKAWKGILETAKSAWDAMLGVGRNNTTNALLSKAQDQYANAVNSGASDAEVKSLAARVEYYQRMIASEGTVAAYQADRIKRDEAGITVLKEADKYASKRVQMEREIAKAQANFNSSAKTPELIAANEATIAGIKKRFEESVKGARASSAAISEAAKGLALYNDLMDKGAGFSATWAEDANKLRAALDGGAISQAQFAQGIGELYAKQPLVVEATKAQADAQKELNKALDEFANTNTKALSSAQDEVTKAQASYDAHGKLASVIQEEALARLENWRIITAMGGEDTGVIDAQIAAKKELIQILRNGEVRDASEKAAKDMLVDQKKAAEESGKYWEDALMRAFESGKGFFESLWDTIKNTLKTQVLKVTVQGVMGTLGLGASGAAMASPLGMAGDAAGIAGFGSNVISGLGLAATGFGQAAAATFSNGLIAGFSTNMANVGALASGGSWITALGAAAPYLAIGAAVIGLITGNKKTPSRGTGEAALTYDTGGNVISSNLGSPQGGGLTELANGVITSMSASYFATAKQLGITAAEATFGFGGNTGKDSKGANFALWSGANGVSYSGSNNNSQSYTPEQLQLEASRAVFTALQASELPGYLSGLFDNITASTATQAQLDGVLAYGNALAGLNRGLMAMPDHFQAVADLSYEATQGLIGFSGGLENLQANLGTYYTNFYSEEEQRLQTIKNINAATAGSGLDAATATRESFRALVEAQDLTTESGQRTYAALISVSGAFAQLTTATSAAMSAVQKVAKSIADMRARAESATAGVLDSQSAIADAYAASQDKVAGAQETLNALLLQSADNMRAFSRTIGDFLGSLTQSNAASQSLSSLKAALSATAVLAQGGDEAAQGNLLGQARAVLDKAKYSSTSAADYARSESFVKTLLGGVQTSIATELQGSPVAATLDQQIADATTDLADAQLEQLRYAQLAADTNTNIVTSTDRVGDEITLLRSAYDKAMLEQTAANLQLGVALAALNTLGLNEDTLNALVAGNAAGTAAENDFAVALGVTSAEVKTLATALGLNDESLTAMAASLNAAVADAVFATLSEALTTPAPVFATLATELGMSAIQMGLLAGALGTPVGLSAVAEGYLLTGLSLSQTSADALAAGTPLVSDATAVTLASGLTLTEATAQLLAGVPITQTALDALAAGININPNATATDLAAGLTLAEDSTAAQLQTGLVLAKDSTASDMAKGLILKNGSTADTLAAGLTLTDRADLLASGLVLAPDAAALADGLYLRLGVVQTLGTALGLNQASLDAIKSLSMVQASATTIESIVTAAYNSVGRVGFATTDQFDPTKIDVDGFNWWVDKLKSGMLRADDFQEAFLKEVVAYSGPNAAGYAGVMQTALAYLQSGVDLPGYAVGTNYVPNDGPAYLHRGEAVIPAAYNPAAGGKQGSDNTELVAEIRALRGAVAALQKAADSSATSNAKTANTLIRVTRDGNALLTTAA